MGSGSTVRGASATNDAVAGDQERVKATCAAMARRLGAIVQRPAQRGCGLFGAITQRRRL